MKTKNAAFEDVLRRLVLSQQGLLGGMVSPQNCMQSPTVNAIITAVSRRIAVTPLKVFRVNREGMKVTKEHLPDHPVARLFRRPNEWQSGYDFWQDATSDFLRYGNFYAEKGRGSTGPVLSLYPHCPGNVKLDQDSNLGVTANITLSKGVSQRVDYSKLFHARGPARDYLTGNSPIRDCENAVALEILAERFGANFFKNGALPLLIFKYMEGSSGFESAEQEKQFIADLESSFSGDNMLRTMLLPNGIDAPSTVDVKHDDAQFLETRKFQRTVISGVFGVPPHMVGDLESGTFNNVEQQTKDFTQNVVKPVAKAFEAAIWRCLLSETQQRDGIIAEFALDSVSQASFKDRQEGLRMQREMGIINSNEWRELEGLNPRTDEEGDEYLSPANMVSANERETQENPASED